MRNIPYRMAQTGPKTTRPRTILILIMVLCWQAGRGIEGLILPERSTAYVFLRSLGAQALHFALETLTVAVALAALGYLWRARAGWVQTAFVALGYFAAQAVLVTGLMLGSPDRARSAFLGSRATRGQTLDPERVARLFDMGWLEWRLVMSLTLFALAAWLAWRHRGYVGEG
jgi:hypothetical protein